MSATDSQCLLLLFRVKAKALQDHFPIKIHSHLPWQLICSWEVAAQTRTTFPRLLAVKWPQVTTSPQWNVCVTSTAGPLRSRCTLNTSLPPLQAGCPLNRSINRYSVLGSNLVILSAVSDMHAPWPRGLLLSNINPRELITQNYKDRKTGMFVHHSWWSWESEVT